ncbi:MAG: prepilin-type N-terminal cleavage/methylation domain-containing protein [Rhizobiales bacterium]|nr:prepilin-type N-terminal cleavage/methylation domain-containing protein [Hyphomicrobiales bacterium]
MSKRQHRQPDAKAGFSLFEMLVALVLMVGILAALASVTAQWLPNWNRGFAHVQRAELLGLGLERLVADLSAAEFVTANGKAKQPLFEGDELAVRFVRTAIGPNTRPGLEVVSISTMSDNRGLALVRARRPFAPLAVNAKLRDLANFSDPVVFMRAPYRAIFSYAGPDHVWRNDWRDADQLPVAIRVSVRDAATQRTLAVSTATVLRVGAPAECARATDAKACIYPPANAPPAASNPGK